ncbi:outer membrane protein assembly factor BamB family protein [Neorhodopirellula pilleata]|uniref:Outer membrane protein assembly factor BamB n=1 Tax=Neorhodopirellula pilleata TaxID=2714738 RepID=A0A5C6AZT2_9BACT|nr:PQQ-binding-like beta-propeller repeat protein [Neorhodopirellula pilleata]TWU03644.1 Outer membrane protein assembly factor BamB precursor [Neorhodopirellula pilleata]
MRIHPYFGVFLAFNLVFQSATGLLAADPTSQAKTFIETSGVKGGFVVHLGAGDGTLTEALRQNDATQVHGLIRDAALVDEVRSRVRASGGYGDVAFDHFSGAELPYVDNLVNLLVAEELDAVSMQEVLRVLVPNGVAMIKQDGIWTKTVKPRPENIDQWTHYLHDATGNSVAHDDVVAPPRHLQWVGSPRWSRHHDRMASMSALVSTGGRMFYIMDEGSRISIQLPPKWKLIARDAFNGTILWKKDIAKWQPHLWPLKSGPTQLSRRLVAIDETVYVTLGYNAPLTALDAATGEVLQTYEGSDATEEVISTGDLLFLVVRKGQAELEDYAPLHPVVGDQARSREFFWNEEPRVLMAFEAKSGKPLWAKKTKISPLSLAAQTLQGDQTQIYFHDGEKVVSLDGRSGELAWESEPVTRRQSFTFNFGPRLVVYEDVVLYAGGDGKMISSDAKTGKKLWDAQFPSSGYQSPQDLMVVDGLIWLAPLTSGKDSGVYTGRDPRTGVVMKQFAPDVDTYWFHHRCYIAKATDNYLIPSRTGTEFVDPDSEHWDINHWVRGGCLYGVMPCNGLTYAPPHNCACYPEAKLFGFNALAPMAPTRPIPKQVPESGRHEQGPAFGRELTESDTLTEANDWPTYRHDSNRSGTTGMPIDEPVKQKWQAKLGGRLTSPVIADGLVYVAQVDRHTLHALNESTGSIEWSFTAGARIDSPPTVHRGRVVFGGADGWVYCLTPQGELVWRYRAAPLDRRTMAYEQLESLWPVHGSVLIHNDTVYCVAGRSNFLDGGLRLIRLDLKTGRKLSETIMDETNPETGNNMQEKVAILQMPVGLPDILTCDGQHVFMKSQKFDLEGNRLEIGPNSGDFVGQVSKQRGPDAHIFAPMGFLDDTWFHRSYWVLGQSFAGGHGGYYQAGRFAPSGRILVNGNGYVYGYGRKPQYLRWTTVLEHQLFAADPNPPEIPEVQGGQGKGNGQGKGQQPSGSGISFSKSQSLNPLGKPITVEAWITSTQPQGVILARGGPTAGFALSLKDGKPEFHVRARRELSTVSGPKRIIGGWHHIVGVLDESKQMHLYVDGELAATGIANELLDTDPVQGLDIGEDGQSAVGDYQSPMPFVGVIDEVRLYFEAIDGDRITKRYREGTELSSDAVLAVSFDDGTARDHSVHRNNGTMDGVRSIEGKFGQAVQFVATKRQVGNKKAGGNSTLKPGESLVKPKWTSDVPIYVRGMVLAGSNLFIVGPPDTINEEETFAKLSDDDDEVQQELALQDAALEGEDGSSLLSVSIDTGTISNELKLPSLPTWDGLAGANGSLFLSTLDGTVMCFGQ